MNISDLHGIDVSSWQAGLSAASLNSVDFAILKISEGKTWNDPQFDKFYAMAKIPVGAYVYSYAVTEADARAEARHAIDRLNGRPLPLGLYIDVEEQRQLALRDSELTAVVKAFCDTVKEGGYRAGAYGSNGNLWAKVGVEYLGADVLMWTAQWGGRPSKGDVWQFTASDHVDGYSERVDGNKVMSERFAQLIVQTEPTPTPEPTPSDEAVTIKLPVLKDGDKGLHVKLMQTALIAKGYSCGWMGADGWFGEQSKIALHKFMKANGIEAKEPVCDATVWKILLEA